jgi:AraC-like DNA-binding protein/quercetin dioxygenase-like cupin family protein
LKRKKQGFEGERILEITPGRRHLIDKPEFLNFSGMGFFPKAKYHADEQQKGYHYYTLIYCIQGLGKAQIAQEDITVKAGDFFFIPKNTSFKYAADQQKPWTVFWFHFDGTLADDVLQLFYQYNQSYKGFLAYEEERILLFDTIYKNLKRGYSKEVMTMLNMGLLHFLTSFIIHIRLKQKDKNQDLVNQVIDYQKKNLDKNITLQEMAQYINISVPHFSSVFKKKVGLSPVDYFLQLKMQRACQYLEYTDALVKEVAFKVGIEDAQYFSRLFSKTVGMSPNAYRKSLYNN